MINDDDGESRDRGSGPRLMTAFDIVVVGVVAIVLATLLNADGLASRAQRLPVTSSWRKTTMSLTKQLQRVTKSFSLDRPAEALNRYRGDIGDRTASGADNGNVGVDGGTPVVTSIAPDPPADTSSAGSEPTAAPKTLPPEDPIPTLPSGPRTPTAQDKARVYVAGDSLAKDLAEVLVPLAEKTGVVAAQSHVKVGTGLVRPDTFDWPAQLRKDLANVRPDIVVVEFGGNDTQGIPVPGGQDIKEVTDPPWAVEYARRVGAVMDLVMASGRKLIWVGAPMARDPKQNDALAVIRTVVSGEAAKRPGATYIDTWDLFKSPQDRYAAYIVLDGEFKAVRQNDGFHLNVDGVKYLASKVNEAIVTQLKALGAAI